MTDESNVRRLTPEAEAALRGERRSEPAAAMSLAEAAAIYLYLTDSKQPWTEPAKSMKAEAWTVICKYAQAEWGRRDR